MTTKKLLKKLVNIPAVTGYEKILGMSGFVKKYFTKNTNARILITPVGSIIASLGDQRKPKIILSAHIDEVGFMITKVIDVNMYKILSVGGASLLASVDAQVELFSLKTGEKADGKIVALQKNVEGFEDFILKCDSSEHFDQIDPVFYKRQIQEDGQLISAPALDNRTGTTTLLILAEQVSEMSALLEDYNVIFIGAVQEELGKGGVLKTVIECKPILYIDIDSAYGSSEENLDEAVNIPVMGNGAALQALGRNLNFEKTLLNRTATLLKEKGIKFQFEIPEENKGGTLISSLSVFQPLYLQVNIPVADQHGPMGKTNVCDIDSAVIILREILENVENLISE